jgi:hypothetical protein
MLRRSTTLAVLIVSAAACASSTPDEAAGASLSAADSTSSEARASACVVIADNGDNVPFTKATVQHDDEYETLEVGAAHGVQFLLKAGHGVARLEATVNGKMVAATFFQTGVDTDSLRLDALSSGGVMVEAQCDHVDAKLAGATSAETRGAR